MNERFLYTIAAADAHECRGRAVANFVGLDDGINNVGIFFVIRNPHPAKRSRGETILQLCPIRATVGGFVNTAAWAPTLCRVVAIEAVPLAFVHCHNERFGIGRMHLHFHTAGFVIDVQNFLPRFAAIGGFVQTAFLIRPPQTAQRTHVDDVRILRMNRNTADLK